MTSSVIVTDIPIKPRQLLTSSFRVAYYSFLLLWPWPKTHDLELNRDLDILKLYLRAENEVAT